MAITVVASGGGAVSATSGTTITTPAAAVTLAANDTIVGVFLFNPSSGGLSSIAKTAGGTATIGTVNTFTKITNGAVVGITMFWVRVTGAGTLQLTATGSTTITSGVFAWQAFRGVSGVLHPTITNNTGTGVAAIATGTATYANSWMVLIGGKHGASNFATGTNVGDTHATFIVGTTANPSGTTNDVAAGVGSPESSTAANTAYTVDMNGSTGDAFAMDMLELVSQFTVSASGGAGGSQADKVLTNLKGVTVTEAGAGVAKVTTNLKAVTVTESASATAIGGAVKAVTETESASAVERVLTNLKSTTVTERAAATVIASSVKAASGQESGSATAKVSTNLATGAAASIGSAISKVLTNLKAAAGVISTSVSAIIGPPVVACTRAFQLGAFEADAFQVCPVTCTQAFQFGAFEFDAFQVCSGPPGGGLRPMKTIRWFRNR